MLNIPKVPTHIISRIFRGYMEPLKILQLHILEVQSRPRFQTAKITMQIHPKQI